MSLHALQVLPLVGHWLSRRRDWTDRRRTASFFAFAAGYALLVLLLLRQALAARPLIPL